MITLTLLCGLISGSYPSLYLSAFNPIFVLKGMKVKTGGAAFIRKGLVVLQFTISIVLIISTIIVYQQIRHVKVRNLGFNKYDLVQINLQGNMLQHFEAIRQEFISTGLVENAAVADHPTLFAGNNTGGMTWAGEAPGAHVVISQRVVSQEYLATLGMKVEEGRDFGPTDGVNIRTFKDSASRVLVTASMERLMGKGSAIGKVLVHHSNFGPIRLRIVGVVKDYVYGDMYGHADPVVFYDFPGQTNVMYVRLKPGAAPELALAKMEAILKKDNPGYPFAYVFVDDQFNNLFASENLISKLSSVFASLAILISCLGPFGLAAYTAERRIKEIGIRKVLAASAGSITHLLSKDFLQLVLLSCVIAFPLAGWMMHHWLQGYAYRIGINVWVFVVAGVLSVLIALVTVSFQAIRAALASPVKSLRAE